GAAALPESLRPPPVESVAEVDGLSRLRSYLALWAESSPRPLVLFLDEIDSMMGSPLISVLRQLRAGYNFRPARFPQSVVLVGMRDVRDYKVAKGEVLHTASPYNIKDRSFLLGNFTAEEVATLLEQHTAETGQVITAEVKAGAWELTRGQPWLVNALARQLVEEEVPNPATAVEMDHLEAAKNALILRRDTHLDSLMVRLREARVRRVIEPLMSGELMRGDRLDDDVAYVGDLGLIDPGGGPVRIANPIYHEIIPRALAAASEPAIPNETAWYVTEEGRLDMEALLEGFVEFWLENAEEMLEDQPYAEIAPHLILMAFLQRIVNAGGTIVREYALGRKRLDLYVRWPYAGGVQRDAMELKVWRDRKGDPLEKGRGQLAGYLKKLGLDHGLLIIFNCRSDAPPFDERYERTQIEEQGLSIAVLRL
ncbi:MAG: ATP-binding protein, partial [bacterium]|nr:ATP-binding protein [bacterium]